MKYNDFNISCIDSGSRRSSDEHFEEWEIEVKQTFPSKNQAKKYLHSMIKEKNVHIESVKEPTTITTVHGEVRLPANLIKKYLEQIPQRDYEFEEQIKKSSCHSEETKLQMIAAQYSTAIMTMRQGDLKHYRHLLEEDIPKDYILDKAYDIIASIEHNSKFMDYDDNLFLDDFENTLQLLKKLAIILKAKRNNISTDTEIDEWTLKVNLTESK